MEFEVAAVMLGMTSEELTIKIMKVVQAAVKEIDSLVSWEDLFTLISHYIGLPLLAQFLTKIGIKKCWSSFQGWYKRPSGLWAKIAPFLSTVKEKAGVWLFRYLPILAVIVVVILVAVLLWKAYHHGRDERG